MALQGKRPQGFAAMDPDKQRAIASKGGKTSQGKGTAHRWRTSEEAGEAGKIGRAGRVILTDEQRALRRKMARIGGKRA